MEDEPLAKDVMSRTVYTIDADDTVLDAAKRLKKKHIRGLVVTSGEEVVGIVVTRDICYNVVARNLDPSKTKVKEIMSKDIITAEEEDTLEDIAKAMIVNKVSRVPIVTGDSLIGILTHTDLIRTWPGYFDLLREGISFKKKSKNRNRQSATTKPQNGICESCENYSDDLMLVGGKYLCPDCR